MSGEVKTDAIIPARFTVLSIVREVLQHISASSSFNLCAFNSHSNEGSIGIWQLLRVCLCVDCMRGRLKYIMCIDKAHHCFLYINSLPIIRLSKLTEKHTDTRAEFVSKTLVFSHSLHVSTVC